MQNEKQTANKNHLNQIKSSKKQFISLLNLLREYFVIKFKKKNSPVSTHKDQMYR